MKITCPYCAAEYNVPDSLAAGRVVRCAKCTGEWAPVLLAIAVEPPPVAEPEPEPELPPPPLVETADRLAPLPPPPPARRLPLLLAWVGSLAVIVAAVVAALVFHGAISHAWPPSQRVYAALGLGAEALPDIHRDVVK